MSLLSSLSLLLLFSDTLKLDVLLLVFLETSAGFQVKEGPTLPGLAAQTSGIPHISF